MTTLFALGSNAQVSLNASHAPAVGTMFIYYDANVPIPAFTFSTSGTTNTWDFTTISPLPTQQDTAFIINPALVPGALTAFPTATHVIGENDTQDLTVIRVDNNGATLLGMMADFLGNGTTLTVPMNPPMTPITFPYTYGSGTNTTGFVELTASGSAIGQPLVDSVRLKSTINSIRDVIATGNLIIPAGTFPSMLDREITTTVDSAWMKSALTGGQWAPAPGFPTTTTDSAFYWFTNQSLQKYAHALFDDTGLHDVVFFKNSVVGLNETEVSDALSIYPNPVQNELHFTLAGMGSSMYNITVFDLRGREVLRANGSLSKMNVSMLAPGLYHFLVADDRGHVASKRFIKE